jgi:NAD(P)H-dependent FMN reductase
MSNPVLKIVTVTTRDNRKGPVVASWFESLAVQHGTFQVETIDLAQVNLPLMNEPEHPRLRHYHHEHTRAWSATVDAADAFVFVTPEYNHTTPPSLVNAIDYLVHEWAYKPAGFVSYGGVSGGLRGVQTTKLLIVGLKMMPMVESVVLPFFTQAIDDEGLFTPPEAHTKAAHAMLDELLKWTLALKPLRPARTS